MRRSRRSWSPTLFYPLVRPISEDLELSLWSYNIDSCDINVSPDKRTILLHSENNLIQALRVSSIFIKTIC